MQKIKNIIFDYGNVVFEIDFKRAQSSFAQLGIQNIEDFFAHKGHHSLFDNFEVASISADEFHAGIRHAANNLTLTKQQIEDAWNSLLIGVPEKNHDVLLEVKGKYRTFLLSNTNQIHYDWIFAYIKEKFDLKNYDDHFERVYFSQQMRLRKPNKDIFEQVINENNLNPAETLFIDDSPQHLEGAKKAGLQTLLMDKHPKQLRAFLVTNGIL